MHVETNQTQRVDSQSAQEGSDVFAHDSEEILPAETPSEINAGSSPEELSRTPTGKTFETGRRGSEMNGEAPHTDNLKATDDSDGEGAKTKSKKSKKAKKRNSTGV